jgi:hypothetical protein
LHLGLLRGEHHNHFLDIVVDEQVLNMLHGSNSSCHDRCFWPCWLPGARATSEIKYFQEENVYLYGMVAIIRSTTKQRAAQPTKLNRQRN